MSRRIIPFVVAFGLICLVMAVAGLVSFSGLAKAEKFGSDVVWSQSYSAAESMKVINLMGDDRDELFIQNTENLTIFDGSGNILFSQNYQNPKTTLGDVNGDNREDIVVFYLGSLGYSVDVIDNGRVQTVAESLSIGLPARVAILRFPSGPQIVLGDTSGNLLSLNPSGRTLWSYSLGSEEIRGLDDARIGGQIFLSAASHDGSLAVLNQAGQPLWSTSQEQMRRMRAFDFNSDGNSEILTGSEFGLLAMYSAVDGSQLYNRGMGQAISEIREVELNGEPSSREFVVGGKDGGVWAYSFDGASVNQLWSGSLSDKVNEISGIDVDEDGAEEAVLGDDSGRVAVFTGNGSRNNLENHSTGITRIDVGRLNGERYVIIADNSRVDVNKVNFNSIPGFQYTPLIVGVIVSAAILIIAAILASIPQKPELKVSFKDKSRESLEAERRMLKESIADVERLRKSGEVTGDAYLARLKRLRGDLAENETAFKAAGFPIRVETIQCPNCGGTLELGMDKCEYCGQVLLS
jgi:hypothetical protein